MPQDKAEKPVVRFAPSPTGVLHVGGARTAIFNFLFARKARSKFILRIEDTDRERSRKEYEDEIKDGLSWLNIKWDEEYRQSERQEIYRAELEKMIENGSAYLSRENAKNAKDESGRETEVVRFRNPNRVVKFNDVVHGDISFDTREFGNFVIARNLDEPLFHLAAVVDDFKMGVTHVIRGEEHISNTPRQILIQEALSAPRPVYAHIPLILAPDRSKLSKRHGAVSVGEYRRTGYLPQALFNYLSLLGWNPGGEREIFGQAELIELFSLERIHKGGAIFNIEKLNWLNREHMRKMGDGEFMDAVLEHIPSEIKKLDSYDERMVRTLLPLFRERLSKFGDLRILYEAGELSYFFEPPEYEADGLFYKNERDAAELGRRLKRLIEIVSGIDGSDFSTERVKSIVWDYASAEGIGNVLWPMRYALSGRDKSPDPFMIAGILGRDETISRLENALRKIAAEE